MCCWLETSFWLTLLVLEGPDSAVIGAYSTCCWTTLQVYCMFELHGLLAPLDPGGVESLPVFVQAKQLQSRW